MLKGFSFHTVCYIYSIDLRPGTSAVNGRRPVYSEYIPNGYIAKSKKPNKMINNGLNSKIPYCCLFK